MGKVDLYSLTENVEKAKLDKILGGANVTYGVALDKASNANTIAMCSCGACAANNSIIKNSNNYITCSCNCI